MNGYDVRINRIWSSMNRSGLNEFESKQSFLDWLKVSKYNDWKVLKRKDTSIGYNESNCFWKVDSRIKGGIELIEDNDTMNNVRNILKYTYSELDRVKNSLDTSHVLMNGVLESKYIKSRTINNGNNKKVIKKSALEIETCIKLIENVLIEMEAINFEKSNNLVDN